MQKVVSPKGMAEGAFMAVITAILALIGAFIPLINFVTFLIVAVPIIIVVVRNDFSTGVTASVVAAFLVALVAGPVIAVFFYLQFMFLALAYGYLFKYKYSSGKILAVGTFVATVSTILIMLITMFVGQFGIEAQKQALYETVDRTIEIYEDYGMMGQFEEKGISKEDLRKMLVNMVGAFMKIFPAILIAGSVFTATTHFIMGRMALRRLGYETNQFSPFREWHLPWHVIWGLIAGWGSYLLGDIYSLDILQVLGQNIMVVYGIILFVLGLSVIAHYFTKFNLPKITRLLIVSMAILMVSGFVMATIFIGLFDLLLDHRQLNKKEKEV